MTRRLGTSLQKMGRVLTCSRAVVVSSYKKWRIDNERTSFRREVFRPKGIHSREEQRLLCIIHNNWRAATVKTAKTVSSHMVFLNTQCQVHCSVSSFPLTYYYAPHYVQERLIPVLKASYGLQNLKRTNEYRNWTIEECKKVALFDESDFLFHHTECLYLNGNPGYRMHSW